MLRVSQSEGATADGRFQAGDPLRGIPATQVTAEWLNSVQSEIANVIESRGMTLDPKDEGQLHKAIVDIYSYGASPLTFPMSNGVEVETDLPMEAFDKTKMKSIFFNALSTRHTTQADMAFFTTHAATFNPYTSKWVLLTQFDPVIFKVNADLNATPPTAKLTPGPHLLSISATGKLQYQTSKLAGENHQGQLTLSHFRYLRAA